MDVASDLNLVLAQTVGVVRAYRRCSRRRLRRRPRRAHAGRRRGWARRGRRLGRRTAGRGGRSRARRLSGSVVPIVIMIVTRAATTAVPLVLMTRATAHAVPHVLLSTLVRRALRERANDERVPWPWLALLQQLTPGTSHGVGVCTRMSHRGRLASKSRRDRNPSCCLPSRRRARRTGR